MARTLERQRLDPRSIAAGRVGGWTFTAIVLTIVGGGSLYALVMSRAPLVSWLGMALIVGTIVGLLGLASHFGPARRYQTTWFRIDDDGLEYERGRWWRHHISVPRARIQHTDVTQSPLERRYGIGTLVLYTAGTEHAAIPIEGLAHETALALRDALLTHPAAPPGDGDGDVV